MPLTTPFVYTYDTTAQGWTGTSGYGWRSGDGDPSPGCFASENDAAPIGGTSFNTFGSPSEAGVTWETWGVPAGKFARKIYVAFFLRQDPLVFPIGTITNYFFTGYVRPFRSSFTNWASYIPTTDLLTTPGWSAGWVSFSGSDCIAEAGAASNTVICLDFDANAVGGGRFIGNLIDTVSIQIDYADAWSNLCLGPTVSSRSNSEVLARATLTNAGSPIGGGSSIKARSAGVVAHAVLTAAQNACLEVYFAGVDDGDDFTIMAYGAPTELCLLNPVAGHEYILEAPAADLARFLGKRMGNVKFRRAGAGGNYSGDIVLRAIELYYKTRTT